MKKNFFALMLVCLIMWSCKKESSKDTTDTGGKNSHKVTFTVGFSKQTTDFQTNGLKVNSANRPLTTQALADQVEVILFAIYNNKGDKVKVIQQSSTDAAFGTFAEELPDGSYTVIVAAGKTGLALSNDLGEDGSYYVAKSSLTTDILTYGTSPERIYPTIFDKEAFYKKVPLTIPGNAPQTVYLNRITTEIQVIVKDAIPPNAKFFGLAIEQVAYKFYVSCGCSASITDSRLLGLYRSLDISPTDIGTLNYTFSQPFLALPKSNVTLYCSSEDLGSNSDSWSGDISTVLIPNVTCLPNQRTILTGNLFGGGGNPVNNGFHAVADTSWNGTPITKPF
ncbi:FimB/Mfa2 family fimbrial subunit [Mucilaginibacter lappiensis]|uniref:FimB/Mfa2 family fimbrial subunit n=1 Tax=Mucilaginibacter lappiensis TaxID=354630 RepID=UPI003D255AFE